MNPHDGLLYCVIFDSIFRCCNSKDSVLFSFVVKYFVSFVFKSAILIIVELN